MDSHPVPRRHSLLLFAVVLLDMIGFGIVIPILPFVTPQLGGSNFDIALIVSSYAVFAGLMGPVWGRLSDRFGRKPILMVCTAGAAISYVILGNAQELWMIYLARALGGVMAGNFPVASAMMADITSAQDRTKGMGLIGAAFGLGFVLGPLLGGLLAGDEGSFFLPCLLASVTSALAVLAAWRYLPESHIGSASSAQRPSESLWQVLRYSQSRLLMLQFVLHTASVSAISYLFPLWVFALLDWKAKEVGIVFGMVGIVMAINQGVFMGRFVALLGELKLLRVCILMFFIGLLPMLYATGPALMVGALLVSLTGATVCMPVLNAMASRRGDLQNRGRLLGAAAAASSLGRVVGPLLAGALLTLGGFTLAWLAPLLMVFAYGCWAYSRWAARPEVVGAQIVRVRRSL